MPLYMQNLVDSTWFTADRRKPYLIKAGAFIKSHPSVQSGYAMLVTDLENTYFCAADKKTLEQEKQSFNPTIETETYSQLIDLVNDAFSKYDPNSRYRFQQLSSSKLLVKFEKQMEIYPFKWEFMCVKIPHQDHLKIIREFLIAPLISTVNSLENKYQILLKRHQLLETQLRDKLYTPQEKQKFQAFQDDANVWNKSISMDELVTYPEDVEIEGIVINKMEFPQLTYHESVNYIFKSLQKCKYNRCYEKRESDNKKRQYDQISRNQSDFDDDLSLDYLLESQHKNHGKRSKTKDDLRDSKKKLKNLKLNDKSQKSIKPLLHDEDKDNEKQKHQKNKKNPLFIEKNAKDQSDEDDDIDPEELKRRQEIERKLHKNSQNNQQKHKQQPLLKPNDYDEFDEFDSQQQQPMIQSQQPADNKKKKPQKKLKFV
eukprot:403366838